MAYDPKRARGHRPPRPAAGHEEVPAPVDGLLDGRIEHPAELDEPLPSEADAAAGPPAPVDEVPVDDTPDGAASDEVAPDDAGSAPDAAVEPAASPGSPEPAPEAETAPAPPPAVAPAQVVERPAPHERPASHEPPVAPVPDSAGSRWIFFAFLAAVLALIVWRLRRRSS